MLSRRCAERRAYGTVCVEASHRSPCLITTGCFRRERRGLPGVDVDTSTCKIAWIDEAQGPTLRSKAVPDPAGGLGTGGMDPNWWVETIRELVQQLRYQGCGVLVCLLKSVK